MTQSCTDFTSDVLEVMGESNLIRADDLPDDNPGRQSEMATDVLRRLVEIRAQSDALVALVLQGKGSTNEAVEAAQALSQASATVMPRFLCSDGYQHCFVGSKAMLTRWVMDLDSGKLVAGDVQHGSKWEAMHRDELADVQEDIEQNGVRQTPGEYDAVTRDSLPGWAEPGQAGG